MLGGAGDLAHAAGVVVAHPRGRASWPRTVPKVRVGDVELCYESRGDGEPLLLVMGLGAQMVLWPDGFCDALARRGYRVIRFDNRDVGESTRFSHLRPPDFRTEIMRWAVGLEVRAPYTVVDMAADTVGLLDALGLESAHIVGASMGGMIAQSVAVTCPGRVRSLTSIMSHPGDRRSLVVHPKALRALLRPPARTRAQAMQGLVDFYRVVGSRAFDRDEADIRHRAALQFERGINPAGFVRQLLAILASHDRSPSLRTLTTPSLVVHGTIDPLTRLPGGRRTARAIPAARMLEIEGMGHDLPPAVWSSIIDAIDTLRLGEPRTTR
jgi:pimeloyl-ACP methyl ester carboxylesterase